MLAREAGIYPGREESWYKVISRSARYDQPSRLATELPGYRMARCSLIPMWNSYHTNAVSMVGQHRSMLAHHWNNVGPAFLWRLLGINTGHCSSQRRDHDSGGSRFRIFSCTVIKLERLINSIIERYSTWRLLIHLHDGPISRMYRIISYRSSCM